MTTDREAELIFEVAERYALTTLEVVRMARLFAWGPFGARQYEKCGIYEPGDDEHFEVLRIAKRLAERPPISELLEMRKQLHEILVGLCVREPDRAKRAAKIVELRELEQEFEAMAIRELARRGLGKIEMLGES
jgi:hypothetical protein